jgi:hypothetical protein
VVVALVIEFPSDQIYEFDQLNKVAVILVKFNLVEIAKSIIANGAMLRSFSWPALPARGPQ